MSTDTGDTFRAQYESEERDRALIRQEIERGVPEDQIEEQVAFQHRLRAPQSRPRCPRLRPALDRRREYRLLSRPFSR
jgi:hypothetical protein